VFHNHAAIMMMLISGGARDGSEASLDASSGMHNVEKKGARVGQVRHLVMGDRLLVWTVLASIASVYSPEGII